jgi:hypothetical protein
MKKIIFAIFGSVLFLISCEENFSPKADFEETYVASCVIGLLDGENKFIATLNLAKTYDVEGILPELNNVDPTVTEANVKLSFPHIASYNLESDTAIYYHPGIPDSILWANYNLYGNPFVTYSANEIPIRYSPLQLDIDLPNGDKVSATTQFPRGVFLDLNYDFPHGVSTNVNTFKYGRFWEISWDAEEKHMYYCMLELSYQIESETNIINKTIEVPIEFVNGKSVYPKFNYPGKVRYSFEAINKTMKDLASEVSDPNSIIIKSLTLNITELNEDLSNYYSSINGFLDEYSVRLDDQVYSNINGGIGILGAYKNTTVKKFVDKSYVESFGYRTNN